MRVISTFRMLEVLELTVIFIALTRKPPQKLVRSRTEGQKT